MVSGRIRLILSIILILLSSKEETVCMQPRVLITIMGQSICKAAVWVWKQLPETLLTMFKVLLPLMKPALVWFLVLGKLTTKDKSILPERCLPVWNLNTLLKMTALLILQVTIRKVWVLRLLMLRLLTIILFPLPLLKMVYIIMACMVLMGFTVVLSIMEILHSQEKSILQRKILLMVFIFLTDKLVITEISQLIICLVMVCILLTVVL